MLGFGKSKAEKDWQDWIAKRQKQREALTDVVVKRQAAKQDLDKAKGHAHWGKFPVLRLTDFPVDSTQPTEIPSPTATIARVEHGLRQNETFRREGRRFSWNISEVRRALDELKVLVKDVDAANDRYTKLLERKEQLQEALDELEQAPPKAGHGALEAFDGEIQALETSLERVDQALETMGDESSLLESARTDVQNAQTRVDELEAAAALGDTDDNEQAAASTALKKAQAQVEKAKAQAGRQEAARRGLQRKRASLAERLEELGQMHADIAREVFSADLESQEQRLVAILASRDIRELVEAINSIRKQYNQAVHFGESRQPANSPFEPLSITIELKHLLKHPEHRALSQTGIKY
ncbi:DNA repair protein RecN [Modicisalibacter radicis]|uniref:hypothetical protein n=1 Tax=Halomonas sp. EAR18 TaxID=2518972 RepID=UPI00109C28A5|nr:hypothetical protein [Halomonas sp. EAR18]